MSLEDGPHGPQVDFWEVSANWLLMVHWGGKGQADSSSVRKKPQTGFCCCKGEALTLQVETVAGLTWTGTGSREGGASPFFLFQPPSFPLASPIGSACAGGRWQSRDGVSSLRSSVTRVQKGGNGVERQLKTWQITPVSSQTFAHCQRDRWKLRACCTFD